MVPDERIRTQVKKLVKGKKTVLEKVQAVYNWVVTATRYVGLEFGIHGYKPYRAPLVVSRGFGDCKDKASLLITMLREAGVEAEFVLIRTNDLGKLSPDPPSLAVFNHAIVYVPGLRMWLDGTAEHHGVFELPFPDQAATAVVLKADGAKFLTTPVAPPDRNSVSTSSKVSLKQNGDAELETAAEIKGSSAAQLRQLLEASQTRRERFEGSLAGNYPGARLGELDIPTLTDLSEPLRYTFTAAIPAFGTQKNGGLEVPVDDGLSLVSRDARLPRRNHDLTLGPTAVAKREVSMTIPEGFEVVDAPPSANVFTKYGKLQFNIEQNGDTVRLSRHFELLVHRVPAEEYLEFVQFCRKVDTTLAGHISLRMAK
jgi:hypothetical protein